VRKIISKSASGINLLVNLQIERLNKARLSFSFVLFLDISLFLYYCVKWNFLLQRTPWQSSLWFVSRHIHCIICYLLFAQAKGLNHQWSQSQSKPAIKRPATSRINCRTNLSLGRQAITSALRHPYNESAHGVELVCYIYVLYILQKLSAINQKECRLYWQWQLGRTIYIYLCPSIYRLTEHNAFYWWHKSCTRSYQQCYSLIIILWSISV